MTAEQFRDLWLRSRLLPASEVQAHFARWLAAALRPESGNDFAGWLVSRGVLTRYQADLLLEGRADNFLLDLYRIEERIGKGAAAKVFRASHPRHGKAAVKVLPPSRGRDAEQLARFQREGRLLIRLQHPGIVRGLELGQCRGLHYLAMEYVPGYTVDDLRRKHASIDKLMPIEHIACVASQSCQGLHYAHALADARGVSLGLVHRDVSPHNLIVSVDGGCAGTQRRHAS